MTTQLGLDFPVVHGRGHVLAGRFRVADLPATFGIDAAGIVRWKGERAHDAAQLRAMIGALR